MLQELEKEIISMVADDQKIRKTDEDGTQVSERNTNRAKQILEQYGWPGKELVGNEAIIGIWLLVQHSDRDVEFQQWALELLRVAVANHEIGPGYLAYLEDRVRINTDQPQLYGTQFYTDESGELVPFQIEDVENLDIRRGEFNLGPFAEYQKKIRGK